MNILLIEPPYKNKYPPIGLMKLSTYHKMRGDQVTFYKGAIKDLVLDTLTKGVIQNWVYQLPDRPKSSIPVEQIRRFIQTGRRTSLEHIRSIADHEDVIQHLLKTRRAFVSKSYLQDPTWKWDRVYVTTLFTFYWHIIIPTINAAKCLVKSFDNFFIGGVTATLLQEELIQQTDLKPSNFLPGLLDTPGRIDDGDPTVIDELPLDYSILDEVDYQYKEHGNYYGYMTRGCVRRCPFCVVPIIEPKYRKYIPLTEKIEITRSLYGEQKNLLLLDNNVMASGSYKQIIEEIIAAGFHQGATFQRPDYLSIAVNNLKNGRTDTGIIIKATSLLLQYFNSLEDITYKKDVGDFFTSKNILLNTRYILPDVQDIIDAYEYIQIRYLSNFRKSTTKRYVDFNQGVDARLITDEKMQLLSRIPIRPLRIAFDSWELKDIYTKAIKTAARYGINYLSNYLLYNFKDKPIELYYRIRHNVELAQELGVQIFSFPMKYHPVRDIEYFSNRTYVGAHWNRKYIRAIQLVLNATKGKVGSSLSFFRQAFGKNEEEYYKILLMPEQFIFYRAKNTKNGQIERWWEAYKSLNEQEKEQASEIIFTNHFDTNEWQELPVRIRQILDYYRAGS